jgi:hypothetical protein
MVSGRTIDEVISVVGHSRQMDATEREKVCSAFGVKLNPWQMQPVAALAWAPILKPLGGMIRDHKTALCSVYDVVDPHFAHCVVIHELRIYDPHDGMVAAWPWSRVIGYMQPVEEVE